jgi:hypothetical protein
VTTIGLTRVGACFFCYLLTGCYAPVPALFAESTEIIPRRAVSLTVAAAGGAASSFCSGCTTSGAFGAGGEGRLRFGIDGRQEIGVSGFGAFVGGTDGGGIGYIVGAKLSYKIAVAPWFAIIAGAGALDVGSTAVFGGDLAVVFAPYTDSRGTQVYTGVRGSFGIPVLMNAPGCIQPTSGTPCGPAYGSGEGITVPLGLALHTDANVRVFLEGGMMVGFNQLHNPGVVSGDGTTLGGYATVAVQFIIR